MTTYNSFSAWLIGKGFGSTLDGSGELANGTSQGFFSSQYSAWLSHVLNAYGTEIRSSLGYASDHVISVSDINQNHSSGLPKITGLTAEQVDFLFNKPSDFVWSSGGKKPVEHTRYYSDEFNFSGVKDTTPPLAPTVSLVNDTGSDSSDLITSDGALSVTPAEAGGSLQYSINDGADWSATFAATEGLNTVQVRQVDAAGNAGASTALSFTLDNTAPVAPAVALTQDTGSDSSDLITSNGALAVSPAEAGGSLQYSINDGADWSATFAATEGLNTVQVRQVDAAGNAGASTALSFTLDNTAPVAPAVALTQDTGSDSSDLITSNGALAVTPAEAGGSLQYSINDGADWSAAFAATEGLNTVQVRQVDAAGNAGASTALSFTLDNTAPVAPAVALTQDTGSDSSDLITSNGALAVSPAEAGGSLQYSINDGADWSATFAATEGLNTVQVRQVDAAGNAGASTALSFTLDNTAPVAPAVALTQDTGSDSSDLITSDGALSVTPAEAGGSLQYSIDDGAIWSATFAATEGLNTVQVRQVDAAGNAGTPAALSFTLDTTAPVAPVVGSISTDSGTLGDGITNDNTLTINGTAENNSTVEVFRGAVSIGTVTADGTGNWSLADPAVLADGPYVYTATAKDAAGNAGAASAGYNVMIDTMPPSDIRINVASSLIAAVSGGTGGRSTGNAVTIGTLSTVGAGPGSTFAIEGVSAKFEIVNGNELKLQAGQSWSDGDGPLNLTLRATDSAGNSYYETFAFKAGVSMNSDDTILGTNAGGAGTSGNPVTGDDFIFGFRGNDALNTNGTTVFGTSGDDALFGGSGIDVLYGGDGNDQMYGGEGDDRLLGGAGNDILHGGAGVDQFRFTAPSQNGLDTVLDFVQGTDKIALQQTGGGWNAAGTAATANGVTLTTSDYIQTRNGVINIGTSDTNKVVELQTAQSAIDITTGVGAAVNAYVTVFNATTGRGELWHDTNWADANDRYQLATFDDMTTLTQVKNLTHTDFMEWM